MLTPQRQWFEFPNKRPQCTLCTDRAKWIRQWKLNFSSRLGSISGLMAGFVKLHRIIGNAHARNLRSNAKGYCVETDAPDKEMRAWKTGRRRGHPQQHTSGRRRNVTWICRYTPMFPRNKLPPYSGLKYVPPKHWYPPIRQHGVTTHRTNSDISTAITSNLGPVCFVNIYL
jgi:hypothetical protein